MLFKEEKKNKIMGNGEWRKFKNNHYLKDAFFIICHFLYFNLKKNLIVFVLKTNSRGKKKKKLSTENYT